MDRFITATLEENRVGSMDPDGKVYDRWLVFRTADGQHLKVLDEGTISEAMEVEKSYTIVLYVANSTDMRYFSEFPPSPKKGEWQGIVVDHEWQAPNINYLCINKALHRSKRVLVETSMGEVLLSQSDFDKPLSDGDFVQWKTLRLELLAVI